MLDPLSRTPRPVLINANRLHFAEQIPQLAKSQTEQLTLLKEEGIQERCSSGEATSQKSQPEATRKRESAFRQGVGPRSTLIPLLGHFPKITFEIPVRFFIAGLERVQSCPCRAPGRSPGEAVRRLHLYPQVHSKY
jgi:hypothetical protein